MTWGKIDDNLYEHPKMVEAGEAATDLYVRGLSYCNRLLTDGRIPKAMLARLSTRDGTPTNAAALVRVGAWEDAGGAWIVHNFLKYNPTREEVEARRADISAKRSEAGKLGNAVRWGTDRKIANASQGGGALRVAEGGCEGSEGGYAARIEARRHPKQAISQAFGAPIAKSQTHRPVPSRPISEETQIPEVLTTFVPLEPLAPPAPPSPPPSDEGEPRDYVSDGLDFAFSPIDDPIAEPPPSPSPPAKTLVPAASNLTHGAPMAHALAAQPTLFDLAAYPALTTISPPPPVPMPPHPPPETPPPCDVEGSPVASDAPGRPNTRTAPSEGRKRARGASATPSAPKLSKAPKAAKAPSASLPPLPFIVEAALGFVAEQANGRFVLGDTRAWGNATFVRVTRVIRLYPDPEAWRLVGAWCGAGWVSAQPVSFLWARTDAFVEAFALARAWDEAGRPVHPATQRRPFVMPATPASSTRSAAPVVPLHTPTAAQMEANRTGRAVGSDPFANYLVQHDG